MQQVFVSRTGGELLVQGFPPIQGYSWPISGFPSNLGAVSGGMALLLLPPPPTPCRCVLFNPDGCCLYAGTQDALRVYGWEPERCFEVVLVNWGKVADLSICNNQLVSEGMSESDCLADSGSSCCAAPYKGLQGGRGRNGEDPTTTTLLLAKQLSFPLLANP